MHLETTPLGEYRPCCLAEESIKRPDGTAYDISAGDTIKQAFESEYMENLRKEFLEGKQPDFVKVAEAYDVKGLRATKPSELKAVLEEAFAHDGPVFVDVVVNREENVFPMVPSGGILNKMILQGGGK